MHNRLSMDSGVVSGDAAFMCESETVRGGRDNISKKFEKYML